MLDGPSVPCRPRPTGWARSRALARRLLPALPAVLLALHALASPRPAAAQAATVPVWTISARPITVVGGAEAEGPYQLYQAWSATRLSDGTLVVGDGSSRQVRFFDRDGRHLRSVGRQGSGPAEFNFLTWVGRFRGDSVYAYDEATRRLAAFGPTGDYANTVTLSLPNTPSFPSVVGAFEDGRVLAKPSFDRMFGRGLRRDTIPFMIYARDGQRADSLGRWPATERFFIQVPARGAAQFPVGFGREAHASVAGNRAVVGSSDGYAVTLFTSGGTAERRLRTDRPPARVPADAVARWRASLAAGWPEERINVFRPFLKDVPAHETYPAFGALAADPTGHYWVQEYTDAPDRPRLWYVYTRQGQPVARVTTPAGFTLVEVGADYVVGRWRDEDGVESVGVYGLTRR